VTDRPIRVVLEITLKKSFASAIDWPGWCRAGKTADAALEVLAAYESRYRRAIRSAAVALPEGASDRLDVVERVDGNGTTEFGAPGIVAAAEREPTERAAAERLVAILASAWAIFDRTAAAAPPTLRKGPRGGGRDTAKIVDHVLGADHAYATAAGIKVPRPSPEEPASVAVLRTAMLDLIRIPSDGSPLHGRWTVRYLARRSAWHVLDHAWEIEDRSDS